MWLLRQAVTTDVSLSAVAELQDEGYTTVTWNSHGTTDDPVHHAQVVQHNNPSITGTVAMCQDWNGVNWDIASFISETESSYAGAAIVGRSHPGDKNCTLDVTGPEKEMVQIKTTGRI